MRVSIDSVLFDPGAGTLGEGVFFKGWTTDSNYDETTAHLDIDDVRSEVLELLNAGGINDEQQVVYNAMLFKQYKINYLDDHNVSLKRILMDLSC